MSDQLPGYELLSKGGFGCSSLWLGADHLLYIEGDGLLFPLRERYRRFAYGDIESVVLAQNSVRLVGAILLALPIVVSVGCLASLVASSSDFGSVRAALLLGALIVVAVAGGWLLARHILRGPCCIGELVTCASRVKPRPLRRWRTAQAALPKLQERIRQARANGESARRGFSEGAPRPRPRSQGLEGWTLLVYRLTGVASLLAAAAVVAMIVLGLSGDSMAVVTSLIALIAVAALFFSLAAISRRERSARIEIRLLLWTLLLVQAVLFAGGVVQFAVLSATRPDQVAGMFGIARMFGQVADLAPPAVATLFLLLAAAIAVLSVMVVLYGHPPKDLAANRFEPPAADLDS